MNPLDDSFDFFAYSRENENKLKLLRGDAEERGSRCNPVPLLKGRSADGDEVVIVIDSLERQMV